MIFLSIIEKKLVFLQQFLLKNIFRFIALSGTFDPLINIIRACCFIYMTNQKYCIPRWNLLNQTTGFLLLSSNVINVLQPRSIYRSYIYLHTNSKQICVHFSELEKKNILPHSLYSGGLFQALQNCIFGTFQVFLACCMWKRNENSGMQQ